MSKREIPQVVVDLQSVRDRLTPLNMWMQGGYGRTAGPNCLMGAIYVVTHIMKRDLIVAPPVNDRLILVETSLRAAIRESVGSYGVVSFNDTNTHEEVLEVIDSAIKTEKAKAGVVEYV